MDGYTEELKKTFVDHQPSAKTLITLHVMFSAIFSTVYILILEINAEILFFLNLGYEMN